MILAGDHMLVISQVTATWSLVIRSYGCLPESWQAPMANDGRQPTGGVTGAGLG